jgi:hypothetical protein
MSLCRDVRAFYSVMDKVCPDRTAERVFFGNMMGIFFSGRDLSAEVLGDIRPQIRFVVAEQKYDSEIGPPQVQIPAFALVLKVRNPEQTAEIVEHAFEKAMGLVSYTLEEKGVPGLMMERPTYADTPYTLAYFRTSDAEQKNQLATRYNFRPALVKLGDYLVISSAECLGRDLIDAIKKEMASPPGPEPNTDTLIEVNAIQLASLLEANQAALVRQNMMQEGTEEKEAETAIDQWIGLVKLLGKATLLMGVQNGRLVARLQPTHP